MEVMRRLQVVVTGIRYLYSAKGLASVRLKMETINPSVEKTPSSKVLKINWALCAWIYATFSLAGTRIWNFLHPVNNDGELFAYVGRSWARGVFPYKQIWDNKPPAIFAINALAAMFHQQFIAMAVFDFVAFLTAIICVNLVLSELECGAPAKSAATFIAASILVIPFFAATGNLTEIYVLPFGSFCIYSFLRATRSANISPSWLLLAGASGAVAGAFKPPGIAGLLAITAFLLMSIPHRVFSTLKNITILWAGGGIVWSGIAAYFAFHNAFYSMLNASLLYDLHYGIHSLGQHSIFMAPIFIADRLSFIGCIWGCVAVWFFFWLLPIFKRDSPDYLTLRQKQNATLLFLWMAADTCGATVGGRYYPHYFLPLLLGMTVVSGIAVEVLVKQFSRAQYFEMYMLALLIPVGVTAFQGQMHYYHLLGDNQQNNTTNMKIASYIRDNKRPGDSLFTWVYGAEIYRMADIYAPTRWESAHYIYDFPGAYRTIGTDIISQLYATLPRFITYDCSQPTLKSDSVRNQFLLLLKEKYQLRYQFDGTCVMVRTPVTSLNPTSRTPPQAAVQPQASRKVFLGSGNPNNGAPPKPGRTLADGFLKNAQTASRAGEHDIRATFADE